MWNEKFKRYLTLATGLFECLGFAGVIFGWASLVFVLKKDRFFADLCRPLHNSTDRAFKNDTMDCGKQDDRFSLVFTIASFMNNFSTIPSGFLFDHFGTAITRFLGIFCYTCGTLMVAFSSPDIEGLLFPAIALIAVGGIVFLITNMQVANLFGNKRSTIITLYNGAFDSSSVVFLLVKVLYEAGLQLRTIFLFISCLSVLHILRTYILLPRTQIPYPLPEGYTYGASGQKFGLIRYVEANASQKQALAAAGGTEEDKAEEDKAVGQEETETIDALNVPLNEQKEPDAEGKEEEEEEEVPSFRRCVLSTLFFSNLFWLSVMQLRHYMFIGTLNPMLGLLAKGNMGLVSQYTNAFAVTQFFGIFCAPWNGLLMDRHKRKAKTTDAASDSVASNRLADMKSTVLSLAVTAMQCVLFSVCAAIPVLTVQYVTFILQVINRSFMYGGNAAFIAITFPSRHFGKIYGLTLALSAVVSLLQYPFYALVKGPLNDDPMYMNISFVILVTLAIAHPVIVYLHCQRETRLGAGTTPAQVEVPGLGEKDEPMASDIDI